MPRHLTIALAGLTLQCATLAQTPSSTKFLASPNPSNYSQPVTLTAIVTAGASGKVTFYDGVTILGVGALSGTQATLTTVMLPPGNRKLRAYYNGDGTYAASSSALLPQTVVAGSSLGFRTPVSDPATLGLFVVAVGDFNGDSRQDVVMVDGERNTIEIYLGNGDGTFQSALAYAVGALPVLAVAGDFNGDGKMDLAVTNNQSNNVSILLGNGDGTFQPAVNYPAANANALAVGDFNGDGKADLVVTN